MQRLMELIVQCYEYDIEMLSQAWMYWWLCIPAALYLMFFFAKWTVLTAPLWLPVSIIVASRRV